MPIHRRPVKAYDADGQLIGKWDSMLEAAKKSGFSKTVIKNCSSCQQRDCEMCCYFRKYRITWRYEEE